MGYAPVPTVTTGDLWTASLHNTYCRDNLAQTSPAVVTTAGDMTIASSSNTVARLAIVPGSVMVSGASLPEWMALYKSYSSLQVKGGGDGLRLWTANVGAFIYATSVGSTYAIANTYTPINFYYYIGDSAFSFWNSSSPTRMTIPSGLPLNRWYSVTGYFHWDGPGAGQKYNLCELRFRKNGTTLFGGQSGNFFGLTDVIHMNASYHIKLSPGDYIELIAYHKNTSDIRVYRGRLSCFMELS